LSRRQRAAWVRPLNAVREALQPAVSTPLNVVRNYARAPRTHTITSKANAMVRPSDCFKLMQALSEMTPTMHKAERAQRFVHAALMLIFHVGVTFEGVLKQVCSLQAKDITGNYLRIPLNTWEARWLRVALDGASASIWHSLTVEGVAPTGKRGRPRKPQALSPLAYLTTGIEVAPDDKTRVQWRKAINAYLAQVSAQAGVLVHPVSAWLPVIRWVLAELENEMSLPKTVVAYRAGQIETGVLPLAQEDMDWTGEPALPSHDAQPLMPPRSAVFNMPQQRMGRSMPTERASLADIDTTQYAQKVETLRAVLRRREDVPAERNAVAERLRDLARDWACEQDEAGHNLHLLADWLATLLQGKKRLGTVRAYLSDGLWLVRYAGEQSLIDLGDEDAEAITEPDGRRRASAWQSWRAHLKQRGETLAHLGKLKATRRRESREEALLPPAVVGQLFTTLEGEARVAAVAGYFGLLRIGEVLRLRLCDMALLGDAPYLEVRNSKGGKSRRVYLTHAPAEAITWLREAQRRVLLANPTLPMDIRLRQPLVAMDGTQLERQVRRGMRAIRLPTCTFHSLRKSRATALVRRGVDVRQVSRWLGHATVSVTWLSYVRIA
jgi:integrase